MRADRERDHVQRNVPLPRRIVLLLFDPLQPSPPALVSSHSLCSVAQRQEHAAFLVPLLEAECFEGVQASSAAAATAPRLGKLAAVAAAALLLPLPLLL